MKNFFVIRDCPYPAPKDGDTIGYDRVTAESWDIKYIMQANKNMPACVLYKHEDGSVVYVDTTDYHTFNMLDAFDIPHVNNDDITVITPQVIANTDGTRSVTVHKTTQDVVGPRGSTVLPSLHPPNVTGDAMILPIKALHYTIRIGKYLLTSTNRLTEHKES